MNTKIKFLTRLLVLTLFLTFISCNDEIYNIKDQHNGVDKNKISLAQFKIETNIDKVEPILSVPNKTSIASKSKLQLSDFVIDTLAIKRHISTDNKTTYTFRIYPLSSVAQTNDIYNLVYRKVDNNWETSIFYLKKLPRENSEHKLFEKIERIYNGKITNAITSKSSSLEMCSYETISVHCDGSCAREGYSQCDGFACPTGQCVKRTINYMSCDSGGGSGGGSSDPGNTSGSGGGASDPYAYSPNYYDNPLYDDPNYINAVKRSYVWANLGDAAQGFFTSNQEHMNYFNETIKYQTTNNWSPESYDFTQEMRIRKFEHPTVFNSITPFLIERKINDTNLNPCAKGVFEKVKNTTNCDIAQVLAKLDANGSLYNTIIKSEVAPSLQPAQTVRNSAYNYTVYISTDYTGKTKLFIAALMFHEVIHAYFMSLFDDYHNANPPNLNAYDDFPALFNYYVTLKSPTSLSPADFHHQQIAESYVDGIARALQEYQTGVPVPEGTSPELIHSDLAWGTLQKTPIFEAIYPIGNQNRQRILNRYETEQTGYPAGQGTLQVQTPLGQPCN
jgi:hypothetical protein